LTFVILGFQQQRAAAAPARVTAPEPALGVGSLGVAAPWNSSGPSFLSLALQRPPSIFPQPQQSALTLSLCPPSLSVAATSAPCHSCPGHSLDVSAILSLLLLPSLVPLPLCLLFMLSDRQSFLMMKIKSRQERPPRSLNAGQHRGSTGLHLPAELSSCLYSQKGGRGKGVDTNHSRPSCK
jgi:hypothetical protein